jgi:dipeptidyl aminopeptidase/acylaminoacyl peptidase
MAPSFATGSPRPLDEHGFGLSDEADDYPYIRTRRMREQRWLLDATIRQVGVDWDQGRSRYTMYPAGLDAEPDFARARERIRKFDDIDREFAAAARRREALGDAAEAAGRNVEAREHSFIAALLWSVAAWPLFGNSPRVLDYGRHRAECYDRFIRHAPHPVRRVEIPFGGASLPAYLHLPARPATPVPCFIQIGGMDSFKEHYVAMYGDKFLERGVARLAVELPGQGEALEQGLFVGEVTAADAGRSIVAWVQTQPDLDPTRLAIGGNSFGSFWATQIAGSVDGLAGCAVVGVIHEPGMATIFETASPTFKARFMYMAGFDDEDAFDAFARRLDLRPLASRVRCPYLALAGEDDELSPISNTFGLLRSIPGPTQLIIYQGERHSLGSGPASTLGPNRHHLVAEWIADRFGGRPAEDGFLYVETTGQVRRRPPFWRT